MSVTDAAAEDGAAARSARDLGDGDYEVIVIGAGHAGCEAALAAARMGRRTLLLTMNLDTIAYMPCNPSIGGPGKGHLVREVDALGGEMGRATDRTFIQIRLLNASRGAAVQALRAQADKRLYSTAMKHALEAAPNLHLKQASVEALLVEGSLSGQRRVVGVRCAHGLAFRGRAVVIATGTFLNGRVLSGEYATPAGRAGEFPASALAGSLRELGFPVRRLQTNTPPRVDARTIDYGLTSPQYGSATPLYFSFEGAPASYYALPINPVYPVGCQSTWRPQLPCYLVHTLPETHRIVRENLHRSPIAPGKLEAAGPRYCPSLEDKVVRFADKESHQFFLEPEGWATGEVYVQGCFTGLPADVQLSLLRTIPALAHVEIMRPGYAIEYDHVPSAELKPSLETRRIRGLYHAGQINGTSGYEEAAAQGLLAGINAARSVCEEEPLVLGREQAYLGVLVDDLITKEISEPYRMFTSHAEYRLLLRQGDADRRLTPLAHQLGLVSEERYQACQAKWQRIEEEIARLRQVVLRPSAELQALLAAHGQPPLEVAVSAHQFLRRPGARYDVVAQAAPPQMPLTPEAIEELETEIQYEGYLQKQQEQVQRAQRLEGRHIPDGFDYAAAVGLRREAQERLQEHRPATVGQAARLGGVSPADVAVLLVHLERASRAN